MNENLKEKLNIGIRCLLFALIIGNTFLHNSDLCIFDTLFFIKAYIDTALFGELVGFLTNNLDDETGFVLNWGMLLSGIINCIFFSYFYAKICGLYKNLQNYNFWLKSLIFLVISILAYLISRYDFKDFQLLKSDLKIDWWIYLVSIFSAFLLNIFFNFLTKKFPKPFEKIGYICSIQFFKDIFKKIKTFYLNKTSL